jgi:L-serine dehydratase
VDLAFTSGIMGWSMLDVDYRTSMDRARSLGVSIDFDVEPLLGTDHPNGMLIEVFSRNGQLIRVVAEAVGGGGVRIVRIGEAVVDLDGKSHVVLVEADGDAGPRIASILQDAQSEDCGDNVLGHWTGTDPLDAETISALETTRGVVAVRTANPIFFVRRGPVLFESAGQMVRLATDRRESLGEIALASESQQLGLDPDDALDEMLRRFEVMKRSAAAGFDDDRAEMLLLEPTASSVLAAEERGELAVGGIHTRASARALAVMHHCNSRGVVCAAPTGGSAGTLPGVVLSLVEALDLSARQTALALFAASAVGLIVARRATFAAEIAGCQVEIGVAGAMAAAAVVEAVGGTPAQAADAAAISLQNTMGSPCDPVAGTCEIPCHTRNAVAASSAFTCADLILGGYSNPIPLDESIDTAYEIGRALPTELRCTASGGCAVAPSALRMQRRR